MNQRYINDPRHAHCIVSRSKGGAFRHIGIQLPNGRVAHCAPGRGEHESSIEEFAMGQDVTIIEIIPKSLRAATLRRIAEAMQSPGVYHAMSNNCEMFVNRMLGRKVESPQLGVAALVAALAVIGIAVAT